jgi:hypothetical protein
MDNNGLHAGYGSAPWGELLAPHLRTPPAGEDPHEVTLTVRPDDEAGAVHAACVLPGIVAGWSDRQLEQRPTGDLAVLLAQVHQTVADLSALRDRLIDVLYARPTSEAERASLNAIAEVFRLSDPRVYERIASVESPLS